MNWWMTGKIVAAAGLAGIVCFGWLVWRGMNAVVKPEGPIAAWLIPDSWSLGRGEKAGKPMVTRFNGALRSLAAHPSFPWQVGIAVPLKRPNEQGLPDREEMRELSDFEDELRRTFTPGNESLFAGVITTGGMREFVLYSSDEAAARSKAKALADATKHHDVQFVVQRDAGWEVYRAFVPVGAEGK